MSEANNTNTADSNKNEPSSTMTGKIGWLLLLIGVVLMIGFLFPFEWLGHNTGLVGLLTIFIGISLLKKRKDQLAKK